MWNEEFELTDGSYSVSDIQGYFEWIIKKHEIFTDNPPTRIYVNKIENRIMFEIKTRFYLESLTLETIRLLGSTKSKRTNDENGENVPHLEITEVVLVHCNIVNNDYRNSSRVFHTFVSNKSFVQLLDIWPKIFFFLKSLIQNFHILKNGLLIKVLNRYR